MKKLAILALFISCCSLDTLCSPAWRSVGQPVEGGTLEIPRGLGTREIVGLLEEKRLSRTA